MFKDEKEGDNSTGSYSNLLVANNKGGLLIVDSSETTSWYDKFSGK